MKRTDAANNVANLFVDKDPGVAPGTVIEQTWLNNVQEEIAQFVEAAGLTLDGNDYTQLQQAFAALVLAGLTVEPAVYSTPAIDATGALGTDERRLFARGFYYQGANQKGRIYFAHPDAIEFSFNAAWRESDTKWVPDVNGTCSVYRLSVGGMRFYRKLSCTAGTGFLDSAWDVDSSPYENAFAYDDNWIEGVRTLGGDAGWKIDGSGRVQFFGAVQKPSTTTSGTASDMFTLPAAARPGHTLYFQVPSGITTDTDPYVTAVRQNMIINTNGTVKLYANAFNGTNGTIWLDGISFFAGV